MSSSEMEKPSFSNKYVEIYENEVRLFYHQYDGKRTFLYSLPKKSLLTFLSSEEDLKYLVDWRCGIKPAKRIETDISTNNCSLVYSGFNELNIERVNYPSTVFNKHHVDVTYFRNNRKQQYPDITDQDVEKLEKELKYLNSKEWFVENVFSKSPNWIAVDNYLFQHKEHGVIHNENGPAEYVFKPIKQKDGKYSDVIESVKHYKNGVLHREDGPAKYYFTHWINTATKTIDRKIGADPLFYLNGNRVDLNGFITNLINKENTITLKESNKKESTMETKKEGKDFIGQLKSDSRQAGIRIACRKSVSVVQSTLIQLLSHNKSPKEAKSIKKGIDALFGSEYGKGLLGYIMGQALPVVKTRFPDKYQDIMEELATEFRIEGMAVAGEEALNSVLGLFKFAESGLIGAMTDLVEPIEKLRVQPEKQEKEIEQPKQESVSVPEQSKQETVKEIGK